MAPNLILNNENLSLQDIHTFLYTPVNLFGYRFLINLVAFLWMYNGVRYGVPEPSETKTYNFIIVGGGTAGSVLAYRLTENPHFNVLLIEAGGTETQLTEVPYIHQIWRDSRLDWKIASEAQETSCLGFEGNRCLLSSGKGLGGSSLVNGMTYIRGNKEEFNNWSNEHGARGWGWDDVFPYYLKSEDSRDIIDRDLYTHFHKSGGLMSVEYQRFDPSFVGPFLDSVKLRGYEIGDYNGKEQLRFNRFQSVKNKGRRVSMKKAYLDQAKERKNLDVMTFTQVTRILFDPHQRAVGVEYLKNNKVARVLALNEVILSAGTLRTPQILLLSGIGDAKTLNKTSIQMIAELPGVGKNLHDHVSTLIHYQVNGSDTLLPSRVNTPANYAAYTMEGKGALTSSGEVAVGFIQTKLINGSNTKVPDISISYHALAPTSFVDDEFWVSAVGFKQRAWDNYFKNYYSKEITTMGIKLTNPKSRGTVSIRSDNPLDDPVVDVKYYSDPLDTLTMVEGVKTGIQIGLSHSFNKYDAKLIPDHFPGCESFVMWSDDYLKCYMKHYTVKSDHYVGTCKMGNARDPMTVVDNRLNVLGVRRLRIVDASVMPQITSGDVFASVVMIAEKAADIIKSDYSYVH